MCFIFIKGPYLNITIIKQIKQLFNSSSLFSPLKDSSKNFKEGILIKNAIRTYAIRINHFQLVNFRNSYSFYFSSHSFCFSYFFCFFYFFYSYSRILTFLTFKNLFHYHGYHYDCMNNYKDFYDSSLITCFSYQNVKHY